LIASGSRACPELMEYRGCDLCAWRRAGRLARKAEIELAERQKMQGNGGDAFAAHAHANGLGAGGGRFLFFAGKRAERGMRSQRLQRPMNGGAGCGVE